MPHQKDAHRTGGSRAGGGELRLSDSIATRNTVEHRTPGPASSFAGSRRLLLVSCLCLLSSLLVGLVRRRLGAFVQSALRLLRHRQANGGETRDIQHNSFARLTTLAAAGFGADGRLNEGRLLISPSCRLVSRLSCRHIVLILVR